MGSRFQRQLDGPCPAGRGCRVARGCVARVAFGWWCLYCHAGSDAKPARRLCLCPGPLHPRALAQVEAGVAWIFKYRSTNVGGGLLSRVLKACISLRPVAGLLPLGVSAPSAARRAPSAEEAQEPYLGTLRAKGGRGRGGNRAASLHDVELNRLTRLGR